MARFSPLVVFALLLVFGFVIAPPTAVFAADFHVTTTADTNDGSCDEHCSLREAIIAANDSGGGTIYLQAGTYDLSIPGQDEDAAANGDLDVSSDITLVGAGSESTFIDAKGLDRVLDIHSGAVVIQGVTIRGGFLEGEFNPGEPIEPQGAGIRIHLPASLALVDAVVQENMVGSYGGGGGILNYGELSLTGTTVRQNKVPGDASGYGAGILNYGSASLLGASIVENSGEYGGGIYNAGELTVRRSSISRNNAQDNGWAVFQIAGGRAFIEETLLSRNSGSAEGAIVNFGQMEISKSLVEGGGTRYFHMLVNGSDGDLLIVNSTLTDTLDVVFLLTGTSRTRIVSSTITEHAGLAEISGEPELSFSNSIIEGGCWISPGSSPAIVSLGHNVLNDGGTCVDPRATDLVDVDPLLGPLADNGGQTRTHALLPGSPAVDAGSDVGLATDQRGVARSQGSGFDIGAFELEQTMGPQSIRECQRNGWKAFTDPSFRNQGECVSTAVRNHHPGRGVRSR